MELELGHRTLGGELTADDPYTKGETLTDTAPHLHCGGLLPAAGYDDRPSLPATAPDLSGAGLSDGWVLGWPTPATLQLYGGKCREISGTGVVLNSTLLNYYGAATFFSVNRMIYSLR